MIDLRSQEETKMKMKMKTKIDSFFTYTNKIKTLCITSLKVTEYVTIRTYHYLLFKSNAFSIYILYLLSISTLGFAILKSLNPRKGPSGPTNIDVFFTSVSAATVSSMMSVEMEVFSDNQLVAMAVLMFLGGEIFTSMLALRLDIRPSSAEVGVESGGDSDRIQIEVSDLSESHFNRTVLKYGSIKFLGHVVLVYQLLVQALGVASLLAYLSLSPSAESVLKKKQISTSVFAVFTVVSSFANCGYIPTNENLIVFRENSGLLLILIPQILLGNTLFPSALRVILWAMGKRKKKDELKYLDENAGEVRYLHLLPKMHSLLLLPTGFGFLLIGFVAYSSLEWYATGLDGMSTYQKAVGVVFQCINTRHSGENIVDLSTVAPAVLVFFIVMMYLPPYTSFVPVKEEEERGEKLNKKRSNSNNSLVEKFMLSPLSYLAIFIVLVCITERKSLKDDPINFSVLNIAFEVTSAYGNVGLTTGYGCDRQLKADPKCESRWYGFVGKWSDEGKIVLILVMIFGKLKKFNTKGGRLWKLL